MKLSHLVPASLLAASLLWSGRASAVTCTNDIDCPDNTCGGQVCSWASANHTCVNAGTAVQGQDGWCTSDTDCKCMGQGAHCAAPHCTFTLPDAGGSSGGDGGGTSGGTDGGSGSSDSGAVTTRKDAGDTSDGGSSGGGSSGGCSLGGDPTSAAPALGLAVVGLAGLFARRRKKG